MFRKTLLSLMLLTMLGLSGGVSSASACPMCKEANDADDPRPKAYMYSILFMLAVPATVFTGFGVGFYRLSKKGFEGEEFVDESKNESPVDDEA